MPNVKKLRGRIVESGYTIESIAKEIGINRATMYRKLSENAETFSVKEAVLISKKLSLNEQDISDIFFA
ncbi:MAG: helix-turn-helix domain-containing protein [Clostridia bacterium]|nr:helix-turn-helix domain-containing protein [Clostridia bacterium]